jgi:hypothetical protein
MQRRVTAPMRASYLQWHRVASRYWRKLAWRNALEPFRRAAVECVDNCRYAKRKPPLTRKRPREILRMNLISTPRVYYCRAIKCKFAADLPSFVLGYPGLYIYISRCAGVRSPGWGFKRISNISSRVLSVHVTREIYAYYKAANVNTRFIINWPLFINPGHSFNIYD